MSYTDIPTDLLSQVHEIAKQIDRDIVQGDIAEWSVEIKDGGGTPVDLEPYAAVVRFTRSQLDWIDPLIKWTEYVTAVRATREHLDATPDPWGLC